MFQILAQSTGEFADSPVTFAILAITLVLSITILWRRYRSRRRLLERVAELEALSEAGRSIVGAELDVSSLCTLFGEQVDRIIDADSLQIALLEAHLVNVQYWSLNKQLQEHPSPAPIEELGTYKRNCGLKANHY